MNCWPICQSTLSDQRTFNEDILLSLVHKIDSIDGFEAISSVVDELRTPRWWCTEIFCCDWLKPSFCISVRNGHWHYFCNQFMPFSLAEWMHQAVNFHYFIAKMQILFCDCWTVKKRAPFGSFKTVETIAVSIFVFNPIWQCVFVSLALEWNWSASAVKTSIKHSKE